MTRIAVRGFKNGVRMFEEEVDADTADLETLATKHALRLAGELHMLEFEFLDEPDPLERFFRMGTDPRGMAQPIALRL